MPLLACRKLFIAAAILLSPPLFPRDARAQSVAPTVPPASSPAPLLPGVVGSDGYVYILGKPEMVAPGRVTKVIPNPTGRYTLLVREEDRLPPAPARSTLKTGGSSLILWDAVVRDAHTLWEQPAFKGSRAGEVLDIGWLPGTDSVAATVSITRTDTREETEDNPTYTLLYADVSRESRLHPLLTDIRRIRVSFSDKSPFALVEDKQKDTVPPITEAHGKPLSPRASFLRSFLYTQFGQEAVSLLNAHGRLTPLVTAQGRFLWMPDGLTLQQDQFQYERNPAGDFVYDTVSPDLPKWERVSQWYTLNPATGTLLPTAKKPQDTRNDPKASAVDLPLRFDHSTIDARPPGGNTAHPASLSAIWLKSTGQPRKPPFAEDTILVASDATDPILLPDLRGILYHSHDAVYAVPLIRLSENQFEAANNDALIRQTVSNGQEIQKAIQEYRIRNDNHLPPSVEAFAKYISRADAFTNPATGLPAFTYLFHDNDSPEFGDIVGYIVGPGGRVNIYPLWVRWQDNPRIPPSEPQKVSP